MYISLLILRTQMNLNSFVLEFNANEGVESQTSTLKAKRFILNSLLTISQMLTVEYIELTIQRNVCCNAEQNSGVVCRLQLRANYDDDVEGSTLQTRGINYI